MKKSNIFTYIEVSKMVESLSKRNGPVKDQLKAQGAYFNIIDPKYFSDKLADEWIDLVGMIKKQGAGVNEEGRVILNAVNHTINIMTEDECKNFINRIYQFHDKLKYEFTMEKGA